MVLIEQPQYGHSKTQRSRISLVSQLRTLDGLRIAACHMTAE
jgi:hypothetical protein